MQSRIPLPTDNIYKFYALFGLLLLISSMVLFVSTYSAFQTRASDRFIELSVLSELKSPSVEEKARKKLLEALSEVDKSDKQTYLVFIGIFIFIAGALIWYGFRKWHKEIQPKQDLLLSLEIEKMRLEVKTLNKSQNANAPSGQDAA